MAQGKTDNLEAFAKRIETRIRKAHGSSDGVEQLICRFITGNNPSLAATFLGKWVEWRYGKPKDTVEHTGPEGGPIAHTIKFGDGPSGN